MVEVNAAFEVLSDPSQRQAYDRRRAAADFAKAFKWPPPTTPQSSKKSRKKPTTSSSASEQVRAQVDQIRADFEKRLEEIRQPKAPTKNPGPVMNLAENKIFELWGSDRKFEGLLMAVGAAFADVWIESKLKKS